MFTGEGDRTASNFHYAQFSQLITISYCTLIQAVSK